MEELHKSKAGTSGDLSPRAAKRMRRAVMIDGSDDDVVFVTQYCRKPSFLLGEEVPVPAVSGPVASSNGAFVHTAPEPLNLKPEPAKLDSGVFIRKDFSLGFDSRLAIPVDGSFGLKDVVALLMKPEHTGCAEDCMCQVSHRRTPGPLKEIIDHKWHGGRLFLLCKPHSQKAFPEYLRLCQVNHELRQQYGRHLHQHRRPPSMKEKWTTENEVCVRERLFPELSPTDVRIQEEIRYLDNTVEWGNETGNGKSNVLSTAPTARILNENARPGPVIKTKEQKYYEVERIIGSSVDKENRHYFVKWLGYPSSECSWEPEEGLQMSADVIAEFNRHYGLPSADKPIIYSEEGLKCSKLIPSDV